MTGYVSPAMARGTRVRWSAEGRRTFCHHNSNPYRHGTIVGEVIAGCVSVLWDGRKTRHRLHVDFLEVVPNPDAFPEASGSADCSASCPPNGVR
jgi:hypothetical protein